MTCTPKEIAWLFQHLNRSGRVYLLSGITPKRISLVDDFFSGFVLDISDTSHDPVSNEMTEVLYEYSREKYRSDDTFTWGYRTEIAELNFIRTNGEEWDKQTNLYIGRRSGKKLCYFTAAGVNYVRENGSDLIERLHRIARHAWSNFESQAEILQNRSNLFVVCVGCENFNFFTTDQAISLGWGSSESWVKRLRCSKCGQRKGCLIPRPKELLEVDRNRISEIN